MPKFRSPWDDPNVRDALMQRPPAEISMIQCESCGNYGYFNEGSHFTCSVDGCGWSVSGEELDAVLNDGGVVSLDDCTGEPGDIP